MSKKRKIVWVIVAVGIFFAISCSYFAGYDTGFDIGYEEGVGKLKEPKDGQIYRSILLGYSEQEDRCYVLAVDGEEGRYYLCRKDKWSGKTKFIQIEEKR